MKTPFKLGTYVMPFVYTTAVVSVLFVCYYVLFNPEYQEQRDREQQFTAKIVSVEPTTLVGCYPSWQDPAPLLHVVLDRKVKIRGGYSETIAETDHLFVLMTDYYYPRGVADDYVRYVDYRQIFQSFAEIPRTWNYDIFKSESCADTYFVRALNWQRKYQQP